jgi:hypothetical protein
MGLNPDCVTIKIAGPFVLSYPYFTFSGEGYVYLLRGLE